MENNKNKLQTPDYIFEVSWEVCNKIGGIYTVISTKAPLMQQRYGDSFIMIGPDLYKGEEGNREFLEDPELFKDWTNQFTVNGLKIRIGRWDIPGKPISILVDFSPLFAIKNQILSELWTRNNVDSIMGGWEYIEPALFGVATGKVIESFNAFFVHPNQCAIAHFHEWMTSAGALYLENTAPHIATVFTTHATFTGRALSGSGQSFYSKFDTHNGDQVAKEFNVAAQHSLEKSSALTADVFTTVSNNTARECLQLLGKAVDKVTTNGFDDSFLPDAPQFDKKRSGSREKLLKIASAVVGYKIGHDAVLIGTSGRYEYRNKGIDIFIDALAKLKGKESLVREIVAFILVPASHTIAIPEVISCLDTGNFTRDNVPTSLTHYLQDLDHDLILKQIKKNGLTNSDDSKVKIVYAPIYLDGRDGVFNMPYYDVLIGMDLTVFPSYYEPFGYTPLESLAFHVPTVTTTLTGFGHQVKAKLKDYKAGMLVLERSDFNDHAVSEQMADHIFKFCAMDASKIQAARKNAFEISRAFLWENLIDNYEEVYQLALERNAMRKRTWDRLRDLAPTAYAESAKSSDLVWKSIMVRFKVPKNLKNLEKLAKNLWWTWQPEARALFASIDAELWEESDHNPVCLLNLLDYERLLELERDAEFMSRLKHISEAFADYMSKAKEKTGPKVAYMCFEYGLHESIPIYSGGLGILAGDYLKEASDQNTDMVAFGLLYRYGYFKQGLTLQGGQVAQYVKQHFTMLPMAPVKKPNGDPLILPLPLRGPIINARVWRMDVGRVPLYLFDTDIPQNTEENKRITHNLYGGDKENRFRQELLLAANTLSLLDELQIEPDLFHYNEGHTAFTGLFRIMKLVINKNLSLQEAEQFVKESTLFTTHTPVPAGQDVFGEDLLRGNQSHFADSMNVPWKRFLGFGKLDPSNADEKFSMTYLAARLAGEINTVSEIHAEVTREMFSPIWKGFMHEELQIKNVTNGVHWATWTAPQWQQLFLETFGKDFMQDISSPSHWAKVDKISSEKIINIKKGLKNELIEGVKKRMLSEMKSYYSVSKQMYGALNSLDEGDLIIGFARRFATYKRADLLFRDLNRLSSLLGHTERPVKFIFAGKAHPADVEGQNLIKRIFEISERPEFIGKIFFIQDYDMDLARLLVQGVDVWLNTPERGNEASGTSGMKAVLNGTLNFSVMDGWWAEGYRPDSGWCLPKKQVYDNFEDQNNLDAETIYNLLEHEIIPEFFEKNIQGFPEKWISKIKNAFAHVAPNFTTTRMLHEYTVNYYNKMYARVLTMKENDFQKIKDQVSWMRMVNEFWDKISILDVQVSDGIKPLELGEKLQAELTLDLGQLSPNDIGVELVFAKRGADGEFHIRSVQELTPGTQNDQKVLYKGEATATLTGALRYGIRYYPKNTSLNYRRDLPLVGWV